MNIHAPRQTQRGATLLIGLIILILMTLLALTSMNLGKSNLQLVSNQQYRAEAIGSAKSALEEILSHTHFSDSPTTPFGNSNVKTYDVNGKGTAIVTVTVGDSTSAATKAANPPPCIKSSQTLPVDPNDVSALGCASQVQQNFGVAGGSTWGSQCADVIWEITAVATDSSTQATTTVAAGVRVRQDANVAANTANYCS